MEMRQILLCLTIKHNCDWDAVYNAISNKEEVEEEEYEQITEQYKDVSYITIIDKEYPEVLKQAVRPPFVLFYTGNIQLLTSNYVIGVYNRPDASLKALGHEQDFISYYDTQKVVILSDQLHQRPKKYIQVVEDDILNYKGNDNYLIISEYINNNKDVHDTHIRLISNLSNQLLIIEATKEHTSVNTTVVLALNAGHDIYCIPHDIDDKYIGNELIKSGAIPALDPDQLIEDWENI